MPWGRYPDRVKAFRKWATDTVDRAELTNSATSSTKRVYRTKNSRRRRRRKKRQDG